MPDKAQDSRNRSHAAPEKQRGTLRVFLGYAPGTGKTEAMLASGCRIRREGRDAVAGFISRHDRPDTLSYLQQLELLPPLRLAARDTERLEFDVDLALQRKPELLLLDDLAHVNAAGCRHKMRYQDVEELLRAGIHVYTTLNVQQLESLTDMVASITGHADFGHIPDSVLESADFLELVDVEPAVLMERFRRGEICRSQDEADILSPFFTEKKLAALREIAWRIAAKQLNRQASRYSGHDQGNEVEVKDHILICLSSASSNKKVIRTAARMADVFHARFTALYVETPETKELSPKNQTQLRENLRLAEQLGAHIATVYGEDVPAQIAEYVRTSRVSKIVLGRSQSRKRGFAKTTVVDKLIALVPNIETYIIPYPQWTAEKRLRLHLNDPFLSLADTLKTVSILSASTLIGLWFNYLGFREANIITIYILGVLLNALMTRGRLYNAVTSIMGVLVFNYFFTEPRYSLQAYDSSYMVTFLVMLAASLLTSTLTMRVREQARYSAQKAYRTEVLLEASRKLQQAKDASAIMDETARQLVKLLDRTVVFYPVAKEGLGSPLLFPKPEAPVDPGGCIIEAEQNVARWVWKNNKRAGAATDTFSEARCLYLAVRGGEEVYAVAAIDLGDREPPDIFEKSLMIAMLGECALALEKEQLNERQKEIFMQIQQEQLRANLLRGISHDLRTPLTSISGNAGILIGNSKVLNEEQKKGLYTDIYEDSMWLIHLVENMLSVSRIENGTLNLNFQVELIEDVVTEALQHVDRKKDKHHIQASVDGDLLMARMDSRLIVQVLINLVDNAIKYTPSGSHIAISARREKDMAVIEVADDGPGIPEESKARVFDMFFTVHKNKGDGRRGLGLGLALCKSIILAHGGTIGVRDQQPHGTVFSFTLPATEVSVYE